MSFRRVIAVKKVQPKRTGPRRICENREARMRVEIARARSARTRIHNDLLPSLVFSLRPSSSSGKLSSLYRHAGSAQDMHIHPISRALETPIPRRVSKRGRRTRTTWSRTTHARHVRPDLTLSKLALSSPRSVLPSRVTHCFHRFAAQSACVPHLRDESFGRLNKRKERAKRSDGRKEGVLYPRAAGAGNGWPPSFFGSPIQPH